MLYSLPTLEHKAPRVEVDLAGANNWTLNCKVFGRVEWRSGKGLWSVFAT